MNRGRKSQVLDLFEPRPTREAPERLTSQLLKWIGNKQRFAPQIISCFPDEFQTYLEPFVGSGAVLGTLAPDAAIASDVLEPLVGIWQMLVESPETVKKWYQERWDMLGSLGQVEAYEKVKRSYNASPNPADLLFLSRSCYGGVVRFRKADGFISTPCGIHSPISPDAFEKRVDTWYARVKGTNFLCADFAETMTMAQPGDLVYCDPPYSHTQSILYGAQEFDIARLFDAIRKCKERNVFVVLSIDGSKRSGELLCHVPIPPGLFEREVSVDVGRSMLRRFQLGGTTLEAEDVRDRLLLTY
jgi:DNA adenine methylase